VLALFRYVSQYHQCIPESHDIKSLSYISCQLWLQVRNSLLMLILSASPYLLSCHQSNPARNLNIFTNSISPDGDTPSHVAFASHLDPHQIIYVMQGARMEQKTDGDWSLNAGETGWLRWMSVLAGRAKVVEAMGDLKIKGYAGKKSRK
jgi:hypothetical protein